MNWTDEEGLNFKYLKVSSTGMSHWNKEFELPASFFPWKNKQNKQVEVTLTFDHGKINPIFERRAQFGEEANGGPGRYISGWTSSPSGLLHPCGLRSIGTKEFVSHLSTSNNENTLFLVASLWLISTSKEALFSRRRI